MAFKFIARLKKKAKMARLKENDKPRKEAGKKKIVSKKAPKKEEKFVVGFEEVTVRCPSCGREFRIVKSSRFSTEGMLCQRCAAGGGLGFEDDNAF